MFSRRHPYLFFMLMLSVVLVGGCVLLSLIALWGFGGGRLEFGQRVGIIEINGVILDAKKTIEDLKRFREDDTIRAIVVRVDSPGGGVAPSQEIYREVRKTRGKKKIVASLGSVAASGGYYVAAATDGIMADPGTLTGSIGVIMGFANYQEILQKIGLKPIVVKSGEYKDMGSPVRPMTPEEQRILEQLTRKIHQQFITDVAEGRGLPREKVEALADGRIFTGQDFKDLGLVDRLGNVEDAVEWAGRMGGITGRVQGVYAREREFSLLEFLLSTSAVRQWAARLLDPRIFAGYLYESGPSRNRPEPAAP